jgi:hypothetical protein
VQLFWILFWEIIEAENVYILSPPKEYKGVNNFKQYILNENNNLTTTIDGDVFENDPNLKDYIKEFSSRPLDQDEYRDNISNEIHPIITLLRVSLTIDPNKRLLVYMKDNYPEIPSIFFCAEGVYLSISGFKIITLNNNDTGKKVTLTTRKDGKLEGSYFLFENSSPGDVLTWLNQNGGVDKFPRILICANSVASRGISFGASNFHETKTSGKLWWHLTEMYMCASKTMDQAELVQTAGRLAGTYNDTLTLRMYATKDVHDDIVKAYYLQEEFISRAKVMKTKNMKRTIEKMPILKSKISSRSLTKKAEYTLNKVTDVEEEKEAGGWDKERYKNLDANTGETLIPIKAVFEELKEAVKNKKEIYKNYPIDEFVRLTKLFKNWSENNNNTGNFLRDLEPRKVYTEREMRKLCEKHNKKLALLTQKEKIRDVFLILRDGNTFSLHPILLNLYEQYF